MVKNILLTVYYVLCISLFAGAQENCNSTSQLMVKGRHILNAKDEPVQLRGLSFSWGVWQGKKYYNKNVVDWLQKDFDASLIRLSMAVQPKGGYLDKPDEQKALITELADYAISKSLYVIIDWHDHHAEQHLQQAKTFFGEMAQRYTGQPRVIYEIWNEPEKQSWLTVKNYATEVIASIREHDPCNLIVVGSPHWDQDVDMVAENPITGFNNIAYSFHFYASDNYHQDELRNRAQKALDKGLPLFVTEWGVGEADGDGKFDLRKTEEWVSWMEKNKLSWANWNITDKKETTAILKPGASIHGGWLEKHLTPAGRYIRELLRGLN